MGPPDDDLRGAIRAALAGSPGTGALPPDALDGVVAELAPFLDAVGAATDAEPLPPEARSLAYLFAWRLGDQGLPAPVGLAALLAWRDAVATERARRAADAALPLLVEGYARAREDRARDDVLRQLAEALPVAELAPGVALVTAAGPLDADAARRLAERASPALLRRNARVLVLDLSGLTAPDAGVLTELWAVVESARMLGTASVVVGDDALDAPLREAPIDRADVRRVATLAAATELVARELGVALVGAGGWFGMAHGVLARVAAGRFSPRGG
jgi:anti-anti-sigma regulatory factor